MIKVKEVRVSTLKEALEQQDYLLEENENYSFRIIEVFMNGFCLEVYLTKYDKVYNLLDSFYSSIKEEVDRIEHINNNKIENNKKVEIKNKKSYSKDELFELFNIYYPKLSNDSSIKYICDSLENLPKEQIKDIILFIDFKKYKYQNNK